MKKYCLTLIACLLLAIGGAFPKNGETIKMTSKYSSENEELRDFYAFEKIDYYKIDFIGSGLIGKDYLLILHDIWNGEISKTDTLLNSGQNRRLEKISSDSMRIRVIARKKSDNELGIRIRFPRVVVESTLKATKSNGYSLRDIGSGIQIKPGQLTYVLAYILPHEKNGCQMYCEVESSDANAEDWGTKFGIEHYILIGIKFK